MEPTGGSLEPFLDAVSPKVRQRDAPSMVELMRMITGEEPLLGAASSDPVGATTAASQAARATPMPPDSLPGERRPPSTRRRVTGW